MQIAVLHSPTAGDRELPRRKLLSLLRDAGYRPNYFSLKEEAWKKKGALRGAKFIVVAGGDGSVRRAVLRLHNCGLPFALLPLGTANNICTSFGIVGKPQKIIARWSKAYPRKIDLGVARGPWGQKLFIESAGVGLIGRAIAVMTAVEEATDHRLERREDRVHRDSSVVLALAHELHPVNLAVSLDRRAAKSDDYLLWEAMNIRRVGPGFDFAPQADPTDGFFEVISATVSQRKKLKGIIADSIRGTQTSARRLTRRKARTIQIALGAGEFRLDDKIVLDQRSDSPSRMRVKVKVELSILPRAFELLLPATHLRRATLETSRHRDR